MSTFSSRVIRSLFVLLLEGKVKNPSSEKTKKIHLGVIECMRRGVKILLWLTSSKKKAEIGKGVCAGVKIIEKSHVHI